MRAVLLRAPQRRSILIVYLPAAIPDLDGRVIAAGQHPMSVRLRLVVGIAIDQASGDDVIGGVEKIVAIDSH